MLKQTKKLLEKEKGDEADDHTWNAIQLSLLFWAVIDQAFPGW